MLERERLYKVWWDYYARRDPLERRAALEAAICSLEGRMRRLGRFLQQEYKGYDRRHLQTALGMALGVHKQLLGGLTFGPSGSKILGGGGA